jgi:hypothetical protein
MIKCLAVILSSMIAAHAVAAARVQAGEWETTMTLSSGKPLVSRYCITADEATAMSGDLATVRAYLVKATAEKTNGRCSVTNVELKGDQTAVTMLCGKKKSVGTTTYYGDRFSAKSSDGVAIAGKKVGACPSK